jgi:alanyl-tRNA synthetase
LDFSPCGGTHPAFTGEVGAVKVLGFERYKGGSRLRFVCGSRAYNDYRSKHDVVSSVAALLSAREDAVAAQVEALLGNARALQKENGMLKQAMLKNEAEKLAAGSGQWHGMALVSQALQGRSFEEARALAGLLSELGAVALLALEDGTGARLVLACPKGAGLDMAALLRQVIARHGGKGGGSPLMAQGTVGCGAEQALRELAENLRQG